MYAHLCVFIHICAYTYVRLHMNTYAHICGYMYIHIHLLVCVSKCVYIHMRTMFVSVQMATNEYVYIRP